ncbi:hypothetical protein SHK09_14770 [Polaribacter sp. PL03]|uniref:hypothetical protein n=1 Tax=Polaribacter sp. PL03 TaxID=3088353 RepID=UPI0029D404A6|nr:hypothetical protein [Polaribacter sp. PL03]MDX6748057.1 hypothetical protein [Polaribacter sp. PL03]
MKKITLFAIITLILNSCSPKLIPNEKSESSLLGKINNQIENKTISKEALIYLNEKNISYENLIELNIFDLKDFTDINYLNKKEGKNEYGETGKNGAIRIKSFLDPLLDYKFYKKIDNKEVLNFIDKSSKEEIVNKNPLLVVSGKPLRGKEIASTINILKIEKMTLMKPVIGYRLYGIRAINGVILIDPKS